MSLKICWQDEKLFYSKLKIKIPLMSSKKGSYANEEVKTIPQKTKSPQFFLVTCPQAHHLHTFFIQKNLTFC
jgi:hypothetical protein